VYDQIKNYLMLQKMQGELEKLRTAAKVETFPERLDMVTQP
jgi:hypothetical protein